MQHIVSSSPASMSYAGIHCYVDASTLPDQSSMTRRAGLGIHIINLQVQPANHIYIRACLQETHSVLSAEATAMALAATIVNRLDAQQVFFYSDSAQLVDFLNSQDHTDPPVSSLENEDFHTSI
jgi:ribonuclease HI